MLFIYDCIAWCFPFQTVPHGNIYETQIATHGILISAFPVTFLFQSSEVSGNELFNNIGEYPAAHKSYLTHFARVNANILTGLSSHREHFTVSSLWTMAPS